MAQHREQGVLTAKMRWKARRPHPARAQAMIHLELAAAPPATARACRFGFERCLRKVGCPRMASARPAAVPASSPGPDALAVAAARAAPGPAYEARPARAGVPAAGEEGGGVRGGRPQRVRLAPARAV